MIPIERESIEYESQDFTKKDVISSYRWKIWKVK